MVNTINTVTKAFNNKAFTKLSESIKTYKTRWLITAILLITMSIYSNPQSFVNLWLSRDQQAMLMVEREEFGKAALTFSDQHWIAYSYYANGEFLQAANVFAQIPGKQALFSQANALMHAGNINLAIARYEKLLEINSQHAKALHNLAVAKKLAENQVKTQSKGGQGPSPDNAVEMSEEELAKIKAKQQKKQPPLTGEMWLQQVDQNPTKFLQNKFQQEYVDANR
ncbi:hypothetical protein [Thalassomonas sp. M1454]|uniref:hypothetical protein n=1 Tax=Thalassomonas sp. M1454 TaxID=2594477 RepID=UPI00117FE594|nr:hypothetical protein [Thalassomonas sp. M1454]TRX56495.1 hypothetical protein FNN08_02885 [Thalassomonas sp. M1454]